MSTPRPPQPETPAPDAFEIHHAEVEPGLRIAYVREGVGGYPLVLVHGYTGSAHPQITNNAYRA